MPQKVIPKPPDRPAKNATRKALLAFHSELNRYHEQLAKWDNQLKAETEIYMNEVNAFNKQLAEYGLDRDDFVDMDEEDCEDCECGPTEAIEGCPCVTCEAWREINPAAMRAAGSRFTDMTRKPMPESLQVGDEVQWLEKLITLKDKRRKK